MKKLKYLLFIISLVAAVGVTYTAVAIKNIPESFDWEDDDE
jgi:hypothetical protein